MAIYILQVPHALKFFTIAWDLIDAQGKLLTSIIGVV